MELLRSNTIPMVTDYQGQRVDLMTFWEPSAPERPEEKGGFLTTKTLNTLSWAANKYEVLPFKAFGYMERFDRFLQGVQLFQPFFVVGVKLSFDKWKISHHKWAIWLYAGAWATFNVGVLFFRHCIQLAQGSIKNYSLEKGIGSRQKAWAETVEGHLSRAAREINDLLVKYKHQTPGVLIPCEDKLHQCWSEDVFGWMMTSGFYFTNLDSVSPVAVSTDVTKTPYLTLRVRSKQDDEPFFVTLYPLLPGVNDNGVSWQKKWYKLVISQQNYTGSVIMLDDLNKTPSSLKIVEAILSGTHPSIKLDKKTEKTK